jgi:peroxiredoxin
MISIGDAAPDFEALTTDGRKFRLSDLRGKPVVLYFFPKAFTPGCTIEAKQFAEASPEFEARGAAVVGISTDDHQTQCDFAASVGAKYPMIGDPTGAIARTYDVIWPLMKLTKRVTYVIDAAGIIRGSFHFEMRIGQHVKSVLSLLNAPVTAPGK